MEPGGAAPAPCGVDAGPPPDAGAAAPRPRPHIVSVFNPIDYRTAQMHCNLAELTVDELWAFAAGSFAAGADCFDLLLSGQPLRMEPGLKAIDVGLGNGAVVVIQQRAPAMLPQPGGGMLGGVCVPGGVPGLPAQMLPPPPPPHTHAPPMLMYGVTMPGAAMAPMGQLPLMHPFPALPHPAFPAGGGGPAHPAAGMVLGAGQPAAQPVQLSPPLTPPPTPLHAAPPRPPAPAAAPRAATAGAGRGDAERDSVPASSRRTSSNSSCSATLPSSSRGGSPRSAASGGDGPGTTDFCAYALTSDGSRSLIAALHSSPDPQEAVANLIPVVRSQFAALAAHQHASKVLTAAAAAAAPPQLTELLRMAARDVCDVAESNSASDVVVALLNHVPDTAAAPVAPALVEAMLQAIVHLCSSVNGRKVLQACAARLPASEAAPLYDAVSAHVMTLATDQCGCITLQRLCDCARDEGLRTGLQVRVLEHTTHLITDPFGNYVLQHAIKDSPQCSQMVARQVAGRVIDFATNKFASNVMERCMQVGPDDVRQSLVLEICEPVTLATLMQDAYGNYVVQSALDHAPYALVDLLRDAVSPLICRSPYGYRIDTKLQRRLKRSGRGAAPRPGAGAAPAAAALPPALPASASAYRIAAGLPAAAEVVFARPLAAPLDAGVPDVGSL